MLVSDIRRRYLDEAAGRDDEDSSDDRFSSVRALLQEGPERRER